MSSMSNQQNNNNNNNNQNKGNYSIVGVWLRRFSESYLGAWLLDWFQASSQAMASAAASAGPTPTPSSGGGPLSFMGCMREASPPPYDDQPPPQQHHHHRPVGLPTGEYGASQIGNHGFESMPKEPKKRRFHPLRGLRRIFRKKSRGAADARISGATNGEREPSDDRHHHVGLRDREEVTLRDPAGRADEIRSRSASELLTDSCDRERLFVRRRGIEESFANLQRGSGQLSVSHDSVFPGEVTHARPLSSLDMHASLERRTAKASNNETNHKDSHTAQRHRISLRVLEQIKTVIENRNQIAAASSTTTAGTTTAAAATTASTTTVTTESTNSLHNRFGNRERSSAATTEDTQAKVPRKDAPTPPSCSTTELSSSPLKEDLPDLTTASLNHTAAKHRIMVRPKNRRPPRRSTSQTNNNNNNNGNSNNNNNSSNNNNMNNSNSNNNNINNNNNNNTSISSSNSALPRIDSISENSIDTLDSLEAIVPADDSMGSIELTQPESPIPQQQQPQPQQQQQQPQVTKPIPILRKSSSRLSRNSEVFEELETKLPVLRKPAVSPDSLESNLDSRSATDVLDIIDDVKVAIPKPLPRTTSTSSDGYEKSNTALSSPKRRSSSNRLSKSPDSLESTSPGWFTKSNEGFDKLLDFERENNNSNINNSQKPVAATRRLLLNPISKSQERVCCSKSSDSLEALEALNSDDSMERRRSSFEIRPRRNQVHKVMSKSTECFESTLVEHQEHIIKADEKRKRASVSEMNLSRRSSGSSSRHSKLLSKSSESFEKISNLVEAHQENNAVMELEKVNMWRGNRRVAHSSESSDNLDLDDNCKLENRNKARRSTPKRLSSGNGNNFLSDEHENVLMRKPSRLQKNSESSELGSTDTLDSERRNTMKSSDSDETLDSLEKDLQEQSQPEQDRKDEETTESVLDKREKNSEDEDEKVGSYWRRRLNSQESKDKDSNNLDIHQLLAYTLVSRIQENGNNDDHNDEENNHEEDKTSKTICSTSPVVVYPKKKQHQQQTQQQSSSDDKILNSTISNLLSSKTDEDLQNMLNGNISEVSTDTKSFKEKLIMFEKLGK